MKYFKLSFISLLTNYDTEYFILKKGIFVKLALFAFAPSLCGSVSWIKPFLSNLLLVIVCLSWCFIALMNYYDQNWAEEKGFIQLIFPNHSVSPKEVRTGSQTGHESGGRSWCRGHGVVLLLACSSWLPSHRTHKCQTRNASPTMGCVIPDPSVINKTTYRLAQSYRGIFLT